MARKKVPKPSHYELKIKPFNPDKPAKFGMKVAVARFPQPCTQKLPTTARKPRKRTPQKKNETEDTYWRKVQNRVHNPPKHRFKWQ